MPSFRLVRRYLLRHPLRTLLTVGSLVVAFFLLCVLRSLITTMQAGAEVASARRLIVQSAVSLFVDLPLHYQQKIATVPGVERVVKWHWFGAYYQDVNNQFTQFALEPEGFLDVYPEFGIVEGSWEDFAANRRGCVIGVGLVDRYGWEIGDTIPLIGMIYPHPDGADVAWEFEVEAIYEPTKPEFDAGGLFFQWEYFQETMETSAEGLPGVGTYVVQVERDADPVEVMAAIDELYENGPQRVQATSEAEFQKQFVSMLGNIPFFLNTIGGAVLAAILLGCVNTMLMAAREQTRDVGVMKALGFGDGSMFALMIAESLVLCVVGGALGVGLAMLAEPGLAAMVATFWPGFSIEPATVALALAATVAVGLFAGIFPAWRANRLRPVEAIGARE